MKKNNFLVVLFVLSNFFCLFASAWYAGFERCWSMRCAHEIPTWEETRTAMTAYRDHRGGIMSLYAGVPLIDIRIASLNLHGRCTWDSANWYTHYTPENDKPGVVLYVPKAFDVGLLAQVCPTPFLSVSGEFCIGQGSVVVFPESGTGSTSDEGERRWTFNRCMGGTVALYLGPLTATASIRATAYKKYYCSLHAGDELFDVVAEVPHVITIGCGLGITF